MGLEAPAADPRFAGNGARVRNRDELRPLLAGRFVGASPEHWLALLDESGVLSGPVNDVLAAFAQPQAVHRQMRIQVEHPQLGPVPQIGLPYAPSATPASIRTAPPPSESTPTRSCPSLGYSATDIAAMRSEGVTEGVGKLRREADIAQR